jgi:hypothetical protein
MFSTWFASKPVILFLAILVAAYLYGNFKELVKSIFAGILNHRFREIQGEFNKDPILQQKRISRTLDVTILFSPLCDTEGAPFVPNNKVWNRLLYFICARQ